MLPWPMAKSWLPLHPIYFREVKFVFIGKFMHYLKLKFREIINIKKRKHRRPVWKPHITLICTATNRQIK
jgi:hypothetical protein